MPIRRIKKGEVLSFCVQNLGTEPNGDVRLMVTIAKRKLDGSVVDVSGEAPESVGLVQNPLPDDLVSG